MAIIYYNNVRVAADVAQSRRKRAGDGRGTYWNERAPQGPFQRRNRVTSRSAAEGAGQHRRGARQFPDHAPVSIDM